MSFRQSLVFAGLLLVIFLAVYTWNRRTGVLDDLATNVGLELTGVVVNPVRQLQETVSSAWQGYVALIDVQAENTRLRARVRELEAQALARSEDMAELRRLRELLKLPVDVSWTPVGARVLAGRLGPNSLLDSFTLNRGYASGAAPGTPIVTDKGLLGRVLRAAPHTSTALLLTNPMSRIAIFTQKTRSPGMLTGTGPGRPLEARYMSRATKAAPGEILVTSGLDGKFPKGIPVARIISVEPSNYTESMTILAEPLADMGHIEEVLLLEPTGIVRPPEPAAPLPDFVGPSLPTLLKNGMPVPPDQGAQEGAPPAPAVTGPVTPAPRPAGN